jgi:hypothetical protein
MKQATKTVGLLILLLILTGCLQVNTLVKIKPDGSGTIEETFLISKEFVQLIKEMTEQMMSGLAEPEGDQSAQKSTEKQTETFFDIFDENKLKKEAIKKGEGVTYTSGKKVITDKFEGYKAIYSFTNINKLKINQNPSESIPSDPSGNDNESKKKKELVTFHLKKGNPSTLMVRLPAGKGDDKPISSEEPETVKTDNQQSEMMMTQMKKMFEGMKITMAIEIQGSIVETNATHRKDSRITMMELDFGKLLQMPEKLKQFGQLKPESLEDAKQLMKNLPGIKVELNKEITIKFK